MNKRQIRKHTVLLPTTFSTTGKAIKFRKTVSLTRRQAFNKKLRRKIKRMNLGYMFPQPLSPVVATVFYMKCDFGSTIEDLKRT